MAAKAAFYGAAVIAVVVGVLIATAGPKDESAYMRDWAAVLPPWPVYYGMKAAAVAIDRLRDMVAPPQLRMIEHSLAHSRTQVVHMMAALRVADHLASGAKTADELAELTGVKSPDTLTRVLRLAVAQAVLAGSTDKAGVTRFRNNALSATLRGDHPSSVRDFIIFQGQEMLPAWTGLLPGLRSGRRPWSATHPAEAAGGHDFWAYLKAKPAVEELFSGAMANGDSLGRAAMLADFRWRDFDRFIDVGGAHGSFLAALLELHPKASGVLTDLPQVVERARREWQQQRVSLAPRAEFAGGSFFDAGSLPVARGPGDVYVLRVILHDWGDEEAAAILRNVRSAIGASNATLALVEIAPEDGLREQYEGAVYMDVQMAVVCGGRERSRAAWDALFARTGFQLRGIHPTRGVLKVVEAAAI